ncbi:hypothetical protein QTP88_022762 [Uroleucon formosanum]
MHTVLFSQSNSIQYTNYTRTSWREVRRYYIIAIALNPGFLFFFCPLSRQQERTSSGQVPFPLQCASTFAAHAIRRTYIMYVCVRMYNSGVRVHEGLTGTRYPDGPSQQQ